MPSITNVGGSLTSAVALTLIAWAVRFVRARNSRKQDERDLHKQLGRYHASLSVPALQLLVQTDPIPHIVVDIRDKHSTQQQPLPPQYDQALAIPVNQIQHALQSAPAWSACTSNRLPYPEAEQTLVFIGESDKQMLQAATHAARHGFSRTATLTGGVQALQDANIQLAEKRFINRDAVAAVLGHVDAGCPPQEALVLDIRRHDERSMYGSIPGTVHVPAHQLPMAFQMEPDSWEDTFHFPQPSNADWVIMQCRTNKRATWAAQLAADAGLTNCLIYKQGVYGWRLQPEVKVYSSYEVGDAPPEPEHIDLDDVDPAAARAELIHLGIIPA
ncbi:TPA: hypothetical protein ACH3X2_008831 [Trebouxia sp. C0005]